MSDSNHFHTATVSYLSLILSAFQADPSLTLRSVTGACSQLLLFRTNDGFVKDTTPPFPVLAPS